MKMSVKFIGGAYFSCGAGLGLFAGCTRLSTMSGVPFFNFTVPHTWLAVATVLLWGAVAFGNVPGLQVYVVRQAERHTPQAIDVASGLNIAAFNLGIAFAAWAGGLVVTHLGLMHTPWIGAGVVLVALALTYWSGRLDLRDGVPARAATQGPVAAH